MDTLKSPSSHTVPKDQNQSYHIISCKSPDFHQKNKSYSNSGVNSLMTRPQQKVDLNFWHTSTTGTHISRSLLPLISRFETLDANSSVFNIKDAQPPHLRLPGSRMGRRNTKEDPYQVKITREKLLNLFDRPGWGAETLKGLRDVDQGQQFNDVPLGHTREAFSTRVNMDVSRGEGPEVANDKDRKFLSPRARRRRESIVRDRIRLFDGGMDFPPSRHQHIWKLSGADGAVAPISPYRNRTTVSPNKQSGCLISPPKIIHGTLAPKTSLGYLRPNETTPRPWRPLDIRQWAGRTTPTNSSETPYLRQRPQEWHEKSLVTPTPTNAVRRVQVIHQDPKRNISEKVTVLSTPRSNRRGRRDFEDEYKDGQAQDDSSSRILGHLGCELNAMNVTSRRNEVTSLERLGPPKKSKIQARIELFSNEEASRKSTQVSSSRLRIQSTPTKLPSYANDRVLAGSTDRVSNLNCRGKSQLLKPPTEATGTVSPKNEGLCGQSQSIGGQLSKLPVQAQEKQALGPRSFSGVSDRIQRFEAFASSYVPNNRSIIVNRSRKRASSHSKRVQSLPKEALGSAPRVRPDETEVAQSAMDPADSEQEHNGFTTPPKSISLQAEGGKVINGARNDQSASFKIQSRQERLSRRSRSRSRSAPSISVSEPIDQRTPEGKHRSEHPRAKRKKSKKGATDAICVATEIALNGASSREQQNGCDMVQEIWIEGSQGGPLQEEAVVVDTVVAQCELAEPRPLRLVETLRMIRLCRGRFLERSGTWRGKGRGSSEKGAGAALAV